MGSVWKDDLEGRTRGPFYHHLAWELLLVQE